MRTFGAHGEHLHELARGIDDRPVETEREAKSVGHEDTYDHDLRDRGAMRRELLSLADRVSSRLRRGGIKGKTVTLKVKYHDFVQVTRAITLSDPTDDGGTIYRCGLDLLLDTEAGARPVRLLGISVSKLVPAAGAPKKDRMEQLGLFGRAARGESGAPDCRGPGEKGKAQPRGGPDPGEVRARGDRPRRPSPRSAGANSRSSSRHFFGGFPSRNE